MSTTHDDQTQILTPPPGKPRKKWHQRWSVRIPALGLAALIAIMAAAGAGSHPAAKPAADTRPAVTAPATHPASKAPAKAPTAKASTPPASQPAPAASQPANSAPAEQPAPAAPAGPTVSQQQALTSAQGYLSDGQGFSRLGLIQQLSSSAGDGFSVADATWAVDHSGADWYAQAVESAKGYMSDGQGFSRASLIDQLTSPAGEQFTYNQAVYAVNQVGLR